MKIALIGSAPSSIGLAPFGDPTWLIWGCSPGAYYRVPRSNAWFETHRWEPPTLGKPEGQKPWFTPEYTGWLFTHPCVWMFDPPANMPGGKRINDVVLRRKYGDFFFTSTLSWMFAMAIEEITNTADTDDPDVIGLWGVDMAATEEYGYQRAGCQFFAQIARSLGIQVQVPDESDLLTPPPLYGKCETDHRWIKLGTRMAELNARKAALEQTRAANERELYFVQGAIDDMQYHLNTWTNDRGTDGDGFADLAVIFDQ